MSQLTPFLAVFLFSQAKLPKHYNTEDMKLQPIAHGQNIQLSASFKIPDGFKNRGNSTLHVYEKINGDWKKIQSLKEDKLPIFRINNTMEFNQPVQLTSTNSEVALDFSVPFCKKICVINSFQGIAKRSKKSKLKKLQVYMKGFLPHGKVKKEFKINPT